jgi:hypothetical protein
MQQVCHEELKCFDREIFNRRKCVYVQRLCKSVILNSEIKSSSNGLCSAKIISVNCGKMCLVSNPISVKPQQLTPTTQSKRLQRNHPHQHHINTKFSQHLIFSNCRTSTAPNLTSAADTSPKDRRSKSRC